MPRQTQPPRLWLRCRAGRDPQWIVLHNGRQFGTGAGRHDREVAEKALAEYIGNRYAPAFGDGHPDQVRIADVLSEYGDKHARRVRRPQIIGGAIEKLNQFFAGKAVAAVTAEQCNAYVDWRCAQADGRAKRGGNPVKMSTARRELVVLSAALNWCYKNGKLDRPPRPLTLPPQSEPRNRHLSRSEAALLLAGAIGFRSDGSRPQWRGDDQFGRRYYMNRHLARFILLGLYTGTRHDAILKLQWIPNTAGGWVDLESGVIYRRPQDATETGKRRPPVPIPPRLMPHLRRWRRHSAQYVIEWNGLPIASQIRKSWAKARDLAGLGSDVKPHTLRHTAATWLLQAGISTWDVAGVLGASEATIRRTYGHHAQGQLRKAVAVF